MDNKIEHILQKLRKLMDLKSSALQCGETGEANAAAAGITRLLKEYDLTMQDIPDEQKAVDPIDMEDIPYRFSYMQHKWYWFMLDVLANHNSCKIIRSRTLEEKKVVDCVYRLIGRKKHREVVLYLISFCAHQFINIGKRKYAAWKYEYMRTTGMTPPTQTNYMKSFLAGCVDGLNDKLKQEQAELPQEKLGALVLANETAINQFMQTMEVKTARNRNIKVDREILEEGREVGRNINLQKGIGSQIPKKKYLD